MASNMRGVRFCVPIALQSLSLLDFALLSAMALPSIDSCCFCLLLIHVVFGARVCFYVGFCFVYERCSMKYV
jgi:hypothetical protein